MLSPYSFFAAKAYSPPPPGSVFKPGGEGLGLYRDAPLVLSLYDLLHYLATEAAPLRLCLDQLVPAGDQPDQARYDAARFARVGPKQQRKHLRDAAARAQKLATAGIVLGAPRLPGEAGPSTRPSARTRRAASVPSPWATAG